MDFHFSIPENLFAHYRPRLLKSWNEIHLSLNHILHKGWCSDDGNYLHLLVNGNTFKF